VYQFELYIFKGPVKEWPHYDFSQIFLELIMVLCDTQIQAEIDSGKLGISPYDDKMLQPASYDLKVGEDAATVPDSGDSMINLRDEGLMVIKPYTPAVVWTLETLRLPLDITGRFGLKSGLSRRGVYASVGPQIDPGFHGRLSVTLFNLTPSSVALNFEERFLTVELHRMSQAASRGYAGEYQNRTKFTSKELDPIIGYKGGQGLGEVVKGFHDLKTAVDTIAGLSSKFDRFLEDYGTQNRELAEYNRALMNEMRALVEHIVGERPNTIIMRTISKEDAKTEIVELFKNKKDGPLFYSDVAERLRLDLEMVVELCHELEKEGIIGLFEQHEAT
jgi:dCTP deaminase